MENFNVLKRNMATYEKSFCVMLSGVPDNHLDQSHKGMWIPKKYYFKYLKYTLEI